MNNILLVDSSNKKHDFLFKLINYLIKHNFNFYLFANKNYCYKQFRENNWPIKFNYFGWPNLGILSRIFVFYYYIVYFFIFVLKSRKEIKTVILLNWPEKIILTPVARIFGWKIIWLELPGVNYNELPTYWFKLLSKRAKFAKLITLDSLTKKYLISKNLADDSLPVIMPGIEILDYVYQDNIFNNLSKFRDADFTENSFTIGTIVELLDDKKIEMLLKAMQYCLEFIPDLRLVIIGEFFDKKKFDWLIKKMKVPNVWLVGDKVNYKKWLNSFDVFVVPEVRPQLNDFVFAMGAMANKLVVIGQRDSCLNDIVVDGQTGLLIELNSKNLAEEIIELQQNIVSRKIFGKRAKALAEEHFDFKNSADNFYKLLSNL